MNKPVDYRAASRLVREYARKQNPNCHVFNDRLVSGARSIKVWGWKLPQYKRVKAQLDTQGYTVKIVPCGRNNSGKQLYRIHVL